MFLGYKFSILAHLLFFFKYKDEILIVIKIEHKRLRWLSGKGPTCQCRRYKFNPWVRKIPWRRKWQPPPVFLLGESPRTEEPGGLQSMGLQSVGHDSASKQQQKRKLKSPS